MRRRGNRPAEARAGRGGERRGIHEQGRRGLRSRRGLTASATGTPVARRMIRRFPMSAPRYVAKKVGDQYVLQRKDTAGAGEDALFASVGGVLALCGFVRGGPLGWLAV